MTWFELKTGQFILVDSYLGAFTGSLVRHCDVYELVVCVV